MVDSKASIFCDFFVFDISFDSLHHLIVSSSKPDNSHEKKKERFLREDLLFLLEQLSYSTKGGVGVGVWWGAISFAFQFFFCEATTPLASWVFN